MRNAWLPLPSDTKHLPMPGFNLPQAQPQIATVIDNKDAAGRVKVQFDWQRGQDTTDFIRMATPDAGSSNQVGKNRGFVFIPEIGDQVMVNFQHGHPDRPFVQSAMFHGQNGEGGYAANHKKTIITRSGSVIQFDDTEGSGSIYIADPSGNTWHMDGAGNIKVKAPQNIEIIAGHNLNMDVGNNFTLNAGNAAFLNVMKMMLVNTPFMQQLVKDYFHTQAGKFLINSLGEMKLEAKSLFAAGQEKTFIHSDKEVILNSKGTTEIKGQEGNKLTNEAAPYAPAKPTIDSKCLVHFRPKNNWAGEDFGFDWMRIHDTTIKGDNKYEDVVGKHYTTSAKTIALSDINSYAGTDGGVYFKKDETLLEDLKTKEYEAHNITWKPVKEHGAEKKDAAGNTIYETYFAAWLSIYPANILKPTATDPKALSAATYTNTKAILSLYVEIEEEPDILRFESTEFLKITPAEISVKGKGKGIHKLQDTITVECIKEFAATQTINVQAVTIAADKKETLKTAGILKVWPNDKTHRRKKKVVLVKVILPAISTASPLPPNMAGQKDLFSKYLKQSLINLEAIEETLNLSTDAAFKSGGTYYNGGQIAAYYDSAVAAPAGFVKLQDYLYSKLKAQLKVANPADEHKYDTCFRAYYLAEAGGLISNIPDPADATRTIVGIAGLNGYSSGKSVVLFPTKNDQTASHEFLHSFDLPHSFSNLESSTNAKYTYEYAKTDNLMDYSHQATPPITRNMLWHWQWVIANASADLE